MENQRWVPKQPRLAATPQHPPNMAPEGRNPHFFPMEKYSSQQKAGNLRLTRGCTSRLSRQLALCKPKMPNREISGNKSPEEEVIKRKHLTTMLTSHPVCGGTHTYSTHNFYMETATFHRYRFTPLTPTGKRNGKLCCRQLSLLQTHSSALHCTSAPPPLLYSRLHQALAALPSSCK